MRILALVGVARAVLPGLAVTVAMMMIVTRTGSRAAHDPREVVIVKNPKCFLRQRELLLHGPPIVGDFGTYSASPTLTESSVLSREQKA